MSSSRGANERGGIAAASRYLAMVCGPVPDQNFVFSWIWKVCGALIE
jgi:hypothetical protein